MPHSLRNKINVVFGIALLILVVISALSFVSTLSLLATSDERASAEELVTSLQSVLAGLNAAEGAQRGYVITGDSAHLPRYLSNVEHAQSGMRDLKRRTAHLPQIAPVVDSLDATVADRLRKFTERLTLYESSGIGALKDKYRGDPEDARIAALALQIEEEARRDVAEHANTATRWARITLGVVTLGSIAAILFLGISAYVIHHETQARTEAFKALGEQELRNAQFLETLPLGIFVIDADGKPAYSNRYARDAFGLGTQPGATELAERVYVNGTADLYPQNRLPSVRALSGDASTVEDIEIEYEGRRIPLRVSAAPIYASDGTITSAIAAFTDISDRRAIERMKDELISVVSHELRTPLTSIRGALGLVGTGRLGTLNDQGKRMIDIAVTDTDRLVRLINDMLDIERMQSGRIEMHRVTCKAPDLIEQAVESVHNLAENVDVRIETNADDVNVWCDRDRVIQTLTNLISNAIKFSPRGGVVGVGAQSYADRVEFRVTDHGRGIPADKIEAIFERFQQVDASDAREKGGAGLGLAISRNIVVQHGGRIWAESDGTSGSTFCFTLPRLRQHTRGTDHPQSGIILIVEDDANLASVLGAQFEAVGKYSVRANNGADAIRLAQENIPDLLLLDLMLPKRDGFDVVEWLRQHEQLRHMPVVVYTALELADRDRERLTLGPTVFLTKSKEKPEEVVRRAVALLDDMTEFAKES